MHTEKKQKLLEFKDQPNIRNHGEYMFYYLTDPEFVPNICICNMLGIDVRQKRKKQEDSIDGEREYEWEESELIRPLSFWRGDAFVVRVDFFDGTGGTYLPLADGSELDSVMKLYLMKAWEIKHLEKSLEWERETAEYEENRRMNILRYHRGFQGAG